MNSRDPWRSDLPSRIKGADTERVRQEVLGKLRERGRGAAEMVEGVMKGRSRGG